MYVYLCLINPGFIAPCLPFLRAQGKCVALGYDKVVGSQVREDECGVCAVTGATCHAQHANLHRTPPIQVGLHSAGVTEPFAGPILGSTLALAARLSSDFPRASQYSLVATLPAGAWNIKVQEDAPSGNFLALRDNSSSFVLNGDGNQEPSKTFISEGAKFVYTNVGNREMLRARGPLLQPVSLLVSSTPVYTCISL
ncbi:A disintegrin and metalloproteinase with thrombospondin motifs 3 [Chionoecetes opilio]|uniref:A disintegrin and metalloproteinase with thrombospondin motifs 3 n=1 Tax=Chionoecetes opilio TaxID=41210 RepID=A0A8J4Y5J2_CHIOP|nr:A disintegrin and metalloproteinase with thrombospondin motifs 3 [Chionoecetes opilio]